jgi:type I restriction enzyme, S subunit
VRYNVPPTWKWVRLGDVLGEPLINGRSVPTADDGFPVLRLTALKDGRIDLSERKGGAWSRAEAERFLVQGGDFLVARGNGSRALVGRGGIVAESAEAVAFPDTLIRVRVRSDAVHLPYLRYVWDSFGVRDQIESAARTTAGIYKINQQDLNAVEIPVPPLAEQRRIVAAIEEHLSDLDAAVAALERVRANVRRYRLSVLESASGNTAESKLPAGWKWSTLGELTAIQGGIQKQPKRRPQRNHYPFLRVANVHRGRLVLDDIHRIELFGNELERLRLEAGDLLIVEGNGSPGEIGRMAVWDGSIENCVHQNHIIRARPSGAVTSEFLAAYWNSPSGMRRVQAAASSTSGLHTLSVAKVSRIPVPVPPVGEQCSLVAEAERAGAVADRASRELGVQLARAQRLRQSVLKRAFEGNLVPPDPADEPASVLLDRIRAERAAAPMRARRIPTSKSRNER